MSTIFELLAGDQSNTSIDNKHFPISLGNKY